MSDGFFIPDKPDGMATFQSSMARVVILIINHEINPGTSSKNGPFGNKNIRLKDVGEYFILDKGKSSPCKGGTTTVVYDIKKQ